MIGQKQVNTTIVILSLYISKLIHYLDRLNERRDIKRSITQHKEGKCTSF